MPGTFPHSSFVGAAAVHPATYGPTSVDPGAVGAGKFWVDSTVGFLLKQRNAANTGWNTVNASGAFTGQEVTGTDFNPSGLTGSVAASRYVGATTTGAPTTGAHGVGDWVVDQTGKIWICTSAGTPGTWVQSGSVISGGVNGQTLAIASLTELTTIAAAATTTTAIQIPTGAIVLAVSVRVTVVIPTAATFTVIGNTSITAFNTAAVSTAATSTDPGTAAGAFFNATAQTIRITPNLTPAANSGRVRVTIFYLNSTPPTS